MILAIFVLLLIFSTHFFSPPRFFPGAGVVEGSWRIQNSFVLTNYLSRGKVRGMQDQILQVQQLYPRIYIACHVDHVKAASSHVHLSARDSGILAHFRDAVDVQPSKLARHLGIARSTMSQALKKLIALGYVAKQKNPSDHRKIGLQLTEQGRNAMQAASVLDHAKVEILLRQLTAAERDSALAGLALLAKAAGQAMLAGKSKGVN